MERVVVCGREFLQFPHLSGRKNFLYLDGHVYENRVETVVGKPCAGLYCAIGQIDVTDSGLRVKGGKRMCSKTPEQTCEHSISFKIYTLHHLFRAVKIGLCYLKRKGFFVGTTKPNFMAVLKELKCLYCQDDQYNFEEFYKERENIIRGMRKSSKPWANSKSVDEEFFQEGERVPGFIEVMLNMEKKLRSARKAEFAEARVLVCDETPCVVAIRGHLIDQALDTECEFLFMEVLMVDSNGDKVKIRIEP